MKINVEEYEIYIRPGSTDMRKGARSLALVVQNEMRMNPFEKKIFAFCNHSRKVIKAIIWDGSGWLEVSKRLGANSFKWPNNQKDAMQVDIQQLLGALKGMDTWRCFDAEYPKYAN